MWLEIKVNTGREQRHFRFVPCEAESAKTQAEGDVFALFKETPRGSFPKGRDAFQSRKQMPRPPGKFGVRVRRQRFRPLSRVIRSPTTLWPGGSCQSPPRTLAGDISLLGGSLQGRRTENNSYREINFVGIIYPERRDREVFRKEAKNRV